MDKVDRRVIKILERTCASYNTSIEKQTEPSAPNRSRAADEFIAAIDVYSRGTSARSSAGFALVTYEQKEAVPKVASSQTSVPVP